MDILYDLNFIAFIVYNILIGTIYNKNNGIWIYGGGIISLLILLTILFFVVKKNEGSYTKLLLFIFFIIFGTIMQTWNMINLQKKSNDDINEHKHKTNWSTGLFVFAGIVAYGLNYSSCDGSGEILCSANNVMIFIIANISVYGLINLLKNLGTLNKDKYNSDSVIFHVGILTLWQIYLYFLSDGFRDSKILYGIKDHITRGGGNNQKSMYELFSFLSVFVIIAFIISNEVLIKNCTSDKLKNFENTKSSINSITWNMIGTMITTIIIILILSH